MHVQLFIVSLANVSIINPDLADFWPVVKNGRRPLVGREKLPPRARGRPRKHKPISSSVPDPGTICFQPTSGGVQYSLWKDMYNEGTCKWRTLYHIRVKFGMNTVNLRFSANKDQVILCFSWKCFKANIEIKVEPCCKRPSQKGNPFFKGNDIKFQLLFCSLFLNWL